MNEHEPLGELWILWDSSYRRWWPADDGPGNPLLSYATESGAIEGAAEAKKEFDMDCVPVRVI